MDQNHLLYFKTATLVLIYCTEALFYKVFYMSCVLFTYFFWLSIFVCHHFIYCFCFNRDLWSFFSDNIKIYICLFVSLNNTILGHSGVRHVQVRTCSNLFKSFCVTEGDNFWLVTVLRLIDLFCVFYMLLCIKGRALLTIL